MICSIVHVRFMYIYLILLLNRVTRSASLNLIYSFPAEYFLGVGGWVIRVTRFCVFGFKGVTNVLYIYIFFLSCCYI